MISERLAQYIHLTRLNKPIGIFLVLWPTLWALWLASAGQPNLKIFAIFMAGVILMRSAGCIINDLADRRFDKYVARTKDRPLATGKIKPFEAFVLASILSFGAFILVLNCNRYTIILSIAGLGLAMIYPLMKRFTFLPQFGLGIAFSWGVPMAFAAEIGKVDVSAWFLFLTAAVWPIIYDTMYAMVDREDDKKIGVKSTAILFAAMDRVIIALLQTLFVIMLFYIGLMFQLRVIYYYSLIIVVILFIYQQWLIRDRDLKNCFAAFLNNNWVGLVIFLGIVSSFQ